VGIFAVSRVCGLFDNVCGLRSIGIRGTKNLMVLFQLKK